jgi:hypothetical protein
LRLTFAAFSDFIRAGKLFSLNFGFRREPLFWLAFLLCAAASLVPIWVVKYPPMVDLPHHAAQVSILRHYNDASFGFDGRYQINWFTPYALAYYVAWIFSLFLPIIAAMKTVVSLSIVMLPLSFRHLIRESGGDEWWSLLGFPASFGLCFLWGFFNYNFAVPISILCLASGIRYAYHPTRRNSFALLVWSVVTFFAHGIAFVMVSAMNTWIVVIYPSRLLNRFTRYWPVWTPGIFALVWYFMPGQRVPSVASYIEWNYYGLGRLAEIPVLLLSVDGDGHAFRVSLLLFAAVVLGSAGRWTFRHVGVFFIPLAIFFFAPFYFLGHSFIYPRLQFFVLAGIFIFLKGGRNFLRTWVSRALIVVLTLVWAGVETARFKGFEGETRDFDEVMKHAQANRSLLTLTFNRNSSFVPAEQFYHFGGWYQAEKGGQLGYSFATLYNPLVQYRRIKDPHSFNRAWTAQAYPEKVRWTSYRQFDYFLVRTSTALPVDLFEGAGDNFVLEARSGPYSLFANKKNFL